MQSLRRALELLPLAAIVLAACVRASFAAEMPTSKSLEGVWKLTKVVRPKMDADTHPQPGLLIFAQGYFSIVRDHSPVARKPSPEPKNAAKLTDAEKVARYEEWAPFTASAGTYEIKGSAIVTHNLVAKQAKGMTMTEAVTIRFDGDTFVTGAAENDTHLTYTRVRQASGQ